MAKNNIVTPPPGIGDGDMKKSVYDVGDTGRVDYASNVSDGSKTKSAAQIYDFIESKGQASGLCPLDSGSKIPAAYLPSTVMEFKGNWDASTNTPTLADGVGTNGDTYRASAAGTQDLGSGSQTWVIGDWVTYNGSIWQKSPGSDAVLSVNSKTGVVVLVKADIGLGNVTNDAQIAKSIGTAKGDIITFTASGVPVRKGIGANGQILIPDSLEADGMKWVDNIFDINIPIGGGVIVPGVQTGILISKKIEIVQWTVLTGDGVTAGAIQCDLWAKAFTDESPPTVSDSITGTDIPRLIANEKSKQSTALTGWSPVIAANSWLIPNIDSVAIISKATVNLKGKLVT